MSGAETHGSRSLAQRRTISETLPSHPLPSHSPRGEKPSLEAWEPAEFSSSALPLPKPKEEEAALPLTSTCRSLGSPVWVGEMAELAEAALPTPSSLEPAFQDVMTADEPFSQALQLHETWPRERGRGENPLCACC